MDEAIKKADVLIEALPYIKKFSGKVIVIKYGGSSLGKKELKRSIIEDIVFMNYAGMKPVLVHGGGPDISKKLEELGKKPEFIDGFRVTDKEALEVVDSVLTRLNAELVENIKSIGGNAFGLIGRDANIIKAKKINLKDGKKDLGFVGEIVSVDTTVIERFLDANVIPVIAPLGRGDDGNIYNINADTSASAIAGALKAEKFVLLTNVPGILKNRNDRESLLHTVSVGEIEKLIKKGTIESGMIPKTRACVDAVSKGVKKSHIIDAGLPHALLLEIFTDKGIGTEIIKD